MRIRCSPSAKADDPGERYSAHAVALAGPYGSRGSGGFVWAGTCARPAGRTRCGAEPERGQLGDWPPHSVADMNQASGSGPSGSRAGSRASSRARASSTTCGVGAGSRSRLLSGRPGCEGPVVVLVGCRSERSGEEGVSFMDVRCAASIDGRRVGSGGHRSGPGDGSAPARVENGQGCATPVVGVGRPAPFRAGAVAWL